MLGSTASQQAHACFLLGGGNDPLGAITWSVISEGTLNVVSSLRSYSQSSRNFVDRVPQRHHKQRSDPAGLQHVQD